MIEDSESIGVQLDCRISLFLIKAALLVIAFALGLLAYVDAQVTDVALYLMLVATLAAIASVFSAALSYQHSRTGVPLSAQRARRAAVLTLAAAVLLSSLACGLTLQLKRFDSDDSQQADTTSSPT